MEVKEIIVSKTAKVNLGNYEAFDSFVSVRAQLHELDDEVKCLADLNAVAERALVAQLVRSYRVRGKQMDASAVAKHHGLTYLPE